MIVQAPLLQLTVVRARWRDQIMHDLRLQYSTKVIGYHMADYITMDHTRQRYRETGKIVIFPSQELLHDKTGANPDTVMEAVKQLIRRGHLELLAKGNQYTGSNQYRVILRKAA